jgi:hypothetical protein
MASLKDIDRCGDLHTDAFGEFNVLGVTVGTNGYQGGDSGHGSRTYICLEDLGSTDIDAAVSLNHDGYTKVEIMLGGDSELDSLIDTLRWAADRLEALKNTHRV